MVKRIILGLLLVTLLAAIGTGIFFYRTLSPFEYEQITDDVWVVHAFPSNSAILRTEEGAVIVDTLTFGFQGDWIRELAEELVDGPVVALINTHYHQDHTHGNPSFEPGTKVISTVNTRDHLINRDSEYWKGEAAELLPNDTFVHDHVLKLGGKTIISFHKGRGHTNGDLVALFVEDRVLMTGDLMFNGLFPRIDAEAGGSVRAWGETLASVVKLGFDIVVPGHGPVTDLEGLRGYQRFMEELWVDVKAAVDEGLSLEETLATVDLEEARDLQPFTVPTVMTVDRESVIRQAWEEAAAAESG